MNFYARKEIKDLLAYLKTIDNARDDVAVRRIINVPKRGIGATTLNRVQDYAQEQGISFYDALKEADQIPTLGRSAAKIRPFVDFVQKFRSQLEYLSVTELLNKVIEETGYVEELKAEDTEESRARIENIDELISKVVSYEQDAGGKTRKYYGLTKTGKKQLAKKEEEWKEYSRAVVKVLGGACHEYA